MGSTTIPALPALLAGAAAVGASIAIAQPPPNPTGHPVAPPTGESLVTATVESSVDEIRPGETFLIAVDLSIAPGWHVYWANPGDTGAPTLIRVDAPAGHVVGDTLWPRPLDVPAEMKTYGYEGETTLFVPVTAPTDPAGENVTFDVAVDWLVCRESCYLGSASRTLTLPVRDAPRDPERAPAEVGEDSPWRRAVQAAEQLDDVRRERFALVPVPIDEVEAAEARVEGSTLRISAPAHGVEEFVVFPGPSSGVVLSQMSARVDGDRVHVRARVSADEATADGEPARARGVIAPRDGAAGPAYEFSVPF